MRTVEKLDIGDHVVYYNQYLRVETVVAKYEKTFRITNGIFLPVNINKEDVLAVGDEKGKDKIKGLKGNYVIFKKEKLEEILKN